LTELNRGEQTTAASQPAGGALSENMDRAAIGDAPKRREDVRFLTGRGAYLDDLAVDGVAHAVVLRSLHAHARSPGSMRAWRAPLPA
jgi:CO/xanthine dehydrogenase Mo-binding subunit